MHLLSELPYLAILAATIAGGVIGALWYSNAGFLPAWTRANGAAPVVDGASYATMTVVGLVGAFAVAMLLHISGPSSASGVHEGLHMGLICGLAIAAMSVGMNASFRSGRTTLALVDGGFHVVRFAVYGLVIGWWPW